MSYGRKILAGLLTAFLSLLLFATAIDIGLIRIAGQPKPIENILDKSGIYNSVVPGLLEEAKSIESSNGNVPLTDPIVSGAATSTLTPQYLRTNVNQALDSIYRWLDGKTTQPQFSINLNDAKTSFADKVAASVKAKAASLPVCAKAVTIDSFDAFSATCLPRGVSPDQAAAQVRSTITGGQGFLDNTNITAADLKANDSNQSVFSDQLKNLPEGYRNFKKSPVILTILSLLMAMAIIFLYPTKLRGVRHIGFMLVGSGLFLLLFAGGLNAASSNKVLTKITLSNRVLQSDLRTLVHDFVHALSGTYMVIGAIYFGLGALAVASFYWFNRDKPEPPAEEAVKAPTAKPATTKPRQPAKKIQVQ